MNPYDYSKHPITLAGVLREQYGDDLILNFSRYKYKPRSLKDERISFQESITSVGEDWLRGQLMHLDDQQELAWHSTVNLQNGEQLHIPMIDFQGMSEDHLKNIESVLPKEYLERMVVFASGRSFHAYFPILINQDKWLNFMFSLLLANIPNKSLVIDSRWVGHRGLARYASLRISWNTVTYRMMPERLDKDMLTHSGLEVFRRRLKKKNQKLTRHESLREFKSALESDEVTDLFSQNK